MIRRERIAWITEAVRPPAVGAGHAYSQTRPPRTRQAELLYLYTYHLASRRKSEGFANRMYFRAAFPLLERVPEIVAPQFLRVAPIVVRRFGQPRRLFCGVFAVARVLLYGAPCQPTNPT